MADVIGPRDAIIVVEMQCDFFAGGASPVPDADAVLPVLNHWLGRAQDTGAIIVAVVDRHPPDHCSFADHGGAWPAHCIDDTPGARLHPALDLPDDALIVAKGRMRDRDNVSAFDDTNLAEQLHSRGIERVWIGGLAQDIAVRATVLDALDADFDTRLIPEGTRPAERHRGDSLRAIEAMRAAGAHVEGTPH